MKSDIRKHLHCSFACCYCSHLLPAQYDTTGISENAAGQNSYSEETETQAEDS